MFRLLLISLGVFFTASAYSNPQESIRVKYDRTSPPPDYSLLSVFLNAVTQYDSNEEEYRLYEIQHRMKIDNRDEADRIFEFLVKMNADMTSDHNTYKRQTLCPLDTIPPTGDQVYTVLDLIDDQRDVIGARYLQRIQQELGEDLFQRFIAWMGTVKASTTIIRFNHREVHKNQNANIVRENICVHFDAN